MKVVYELPKRYYKRATKGEKRQREIIAFARSGAKYGLLEYMTCKNAYGDREEYEKAYKKYKDNGGDGFFSFKTINGKVYIVKEVEA